MRTFLLLILTATRRCTGLFEGGGGAKYEIENRQVTARQRGHKYITGCENQMEDSAINSHGNSVLHRSVWGRGGSKMNNAKIIISQHVKMFILGVECACRNT